MREVRGMNLKLEVHGATKNVGHCQRMDAGGQGSVA